MLLLRGATVVQLFVDAVNGFNTCSSCEEQLPANQIKNPITSFNTCSSCEEQHLSLTCCPSPQEFQYMLLLRGATGIYYITYRQKQFQYMLLLRGATSADLHRFVKNDVSIHAPLARSNQLLHNIALDILRFNTCSSCEEQLITTWRRNGNTCFNTCSSCEEQPSRV